MSQLSDFLESQMEDHPDGFMEASETEICTDLDVRSTLVKIAITFSTLAIKRFAEEEFDPANLMLSTAASINASFTLGFELGKRWAETQALEAEHA